MSDDEWTVEGQPVTVPQGHEAQEFILAYASTRYPPGTLATVSTAEGGARRIASVVLPSHQGAPTPGTPEQPAAVIAPAPPSATALPAQAPPSATAVSAQAPPSPTAVSAQAPPAAGRSARRAIIAALLAAVVLLAVLAAIIVPRLSEPPTEQAPMVWQQTWAASPESGPITADAMQLAGAGVILNVDGGTAEAFRQDDGEAIGSTPAPEGSRVGVGPDFMVVATSTDGTSSGAVITSTGIVPFTDEPGALIRRGTVPFLAGGTGAEQFALIYRNDQWEEVETPTPGLAPLAATESSVVWLGTGRSLTLTDYSGDITRESTLTTPENAVEATQRAFITDTLIGVVWTSADGTKDLVTHALTTGEILEQTPVDAQIFDKTGAWITSSTSPPEVDSAAVPRSYWTLDGDTPEKLSAPCSDPIPSGRTLWCSEGNIFADSSGASLPAGTRPIPSPTDTVPAISGDQLALYSP
ncbi:hypothetical protein C4K88_07480 [Arthrobacter pityocampae]|uniref:Uncharacterized protein n=1 Tax=Arthrobacter pityocampae TaxID=547334 RepID=A0A2S5IY98_9MICC|nr:hypothetical protein [Arthrobacter pityocampae]PPB49524.1 hypothetical protein C4K88_07480 [Arthrobacter pityocampae]